MSAHQQLQTRWEETHEEFTHRRSLAAAEGSGWAGTVIGVLLALCALALVLWR